MRTAKTSVLITVLALHASVIGIVYLSTRPDIETIIPEKITPSNSEAAKTPKTTKEVKPTFQIHVVGADDYLGKIASKYKVSAQQIVKLNNIGNPNRIQRGQKLKIPLSGVQ